MEGHTLFVGVTPFTLLWAGAPMSILCVFQVTKKRKPSVLCTHQIHFPDGLDRTEPPLDFCDYFIIIWLLAVISGG